MVVLMGMKTAVKLVSLTVEETAATSVALMGFQLVVMKEILLVVKKAVKLAELKGVKMAVRKVVEKADMMVDR